MKAKFGPRNSSFNALKIRVQHRVLVKKRREAQRASTHNNRQLAVKFERQIREQQTLTCLYILSILSKIHDGNNEGHATGVITEYALPVRNHT